MSRLRFAVACVATLALCAGVPSSAHAITNGQSCSPYYTQASAPTAAFSTSPSTPSSGDTVNFDAGGSTSGTAHVWTWVAGDAQCESTSTITDPIGSYHWDFGDGTTTTTGGSATSHVYPVPGTYTVTLTVTEQDCQGGANAHCFTATTSHAVQVANRPPVAAFAASPTSLPSGQSVDLDASGSSDPDGSVASYHWDFGDGDTLDTAQAAASHIFAVAGQYSVTLTVTDNLGTTSTATHAVTVTNRAPAAAFTAPATATVGQIAAFDASASTDPDGHVASYHWVFGDGQVQDTSGPTVTHAYAAAATITVTLTVTDDRGATATAHHDVTVAAASAGPTGSGTTTGAGTGSIPGVTTTATGATTTSSGGDTTGQSSGATTPPVLSALALSTTRLRRSVTISYRDSAAATTTFTVERLRPGVRSGGRCITPRRRTAAHAKRCTTAKVVARFTHADSGGAQRVALTTRVAGRRLAAGSYELLASAANPNGTSPPVAVRFTVAG